MIINGFRLFRKGETDFQKGLGLGIMACVISCMAGNLTGGYWNYFAVVGYMYTLAGLATRALVDLQQEKSVELPDHDQIETIPQPESPWSNIESDVQESPKFY